MSCSSVSYSCCPATTRGCRTIGHEAPDIGAATCELSAATARCSSCSCSASGCSWRATAARPHQRQWAQRAQAAAPSRQKSRLNELSATLRAKRRSAAARLESRSAQYDIPRVRPCCWSALAHGDTPLLGLNAPSRASMRERLSRLAPSSGLTSRTAAGTGVAAGPAPPASPSMSAASDRTEMVRTTRRARPAAMHGGHLHVDGSE
jgi:hypothetical protein